MARPDQMRDRLIAAIPSMRAFAFSLCGDQARADDLVQETLVKAWSNLASFDEGTNLRAWLFTILRHVLYSEHRKRRREVQDTDGTFTGNLHAVDDQLAHMDFQDLRRALDALPVDQREAVVLVGGAGCSYEEAAEICNCAVGTIKSRVNRARRRLAELLGEDAGAAVEVRPAVPRQARARQG